MIKINGVCPAVKKSGFSSKLTQYSWFGYLDYTQSAEKDKYNSSYSAVNAVDIKKIHLTDAPLTISKPLTNFYSAPCAVYTEIDR